MPQGKLDYRVALLMILVLPMIACGGKGGVSGSGPDGIGSTRSTKVTPGVFVAGGLHSLAIKSNGTVCAWGRNGNGELGDGTTTDRFTPVQLPGMSDVLAVSAGSDHSVALKSDGTVWTWGSNSCSQMGNGNTGWTAEGWPPSQVAGLSGVIAISAGNSHTLALKRDGTVWAWGANESGQLGDGTITERSRPVQVTGMTDVAAVSAGTDHSVAIRNDGTVWAWGANEYGQVGDGTTIRRTTPAQVSGFSGVTAVSAGDLFTIALRNDGTIWTWGANDYGQLGDGTTTGRSKPGAVSGLSGVTAVSAGGGFAIALKHDGTVWTWGWNHYGELGDGTTDDRYLPGQLPGLTNAVAVSAGFMHAIAVEGDGAAWAWGNNLYGQVGDGTMRDRSAPVRVLDGVSPDGAVAAPTFTPEPGVYSSSQTVTISTVTPGATIRYSTDGTLLNETSGRIYTGPIPVTESSTVIRAVAYKPGATTSSVSAIYYVSGSSPSDGTSGAVVDAPTFGVSPGWYAESQTVTIATATPGATIRYTTDGSNPSQAAGTVYAGPITVSESTVVKAVAFKPGSATSHISIASYDIGGTGSMVWISDAPKCNPGPGVYAMPVTVTLWTLGNSGTPVSTIRYTTDGSTPTETNGTPYTGPFTISTSTTIKAIAFYRGSQPSGVATWRYTITGVPIAPPVFGTAPGAYETAQRLTLSAPPGAAIRYTTDGSTPTGTDGILYTGPITVSASTTVRAVACKEGRVTSPVSTGAYAIAPTGRMGAPRFSPVPGTYTTARSVTISAPAGATIRYTVDGSTPSETSGSVYAGPVSIAASTTIRAVAYGMGESPSPVSVGAYRITPVVVSAGSWHGAAIRSDGTVWTWGWNQYGQLGDGTRSGDGRTTSASRLTPASVSGISDVVAISASFSHNIALKGDGTVWGWGANENGQLGDGSMSDRPSPVQVPGISDVVSVSAGGNHTVALRSDGTVWAWGWNLNGQLGDGTREGRTTPVQVSGLSGVVAISAGAVHTVAVKNDGTVWAWGYACNGTYHAGGSVTPVQMAGLSGAVAVSAGGSHTAVIKDDGTVWTWGENGSGQLGDGSTANRLVPVPVSGLAGAVAVGTGDYHTLAVRNDGTAWAWGESVYGQLADGERSGDGTPIYGINRLSPVQVSGVSGVVAVSAGYGTSFAVTGDGLAWAWGLNDYGATGDGTGGYDMGINARVGSVARSPGRLTPVRVAM